MFSHIPEYHDFETGTGDFDYPLHMSYKKPEKKQGLPIYLLPDLTEVNFFSNVYTHASNIVPLSSLEFLINEAGKFTSEKKSREDIEFYFDLEQKNYVANFLRGVVWFPITKDIDLQNYAPLMFLEKPRIAGFISRFINSYSFEPKIYKIKKI